MLCLSLTGLKLDAGEVMNSRKTPYGVCSRGLNAGYHWLPQGDNGCHGTFMDIMLTKADLLKRNLHTKSTEVRLVLITMLVYLMPIPVYPFSSIFFPASDGCRLVRIQRLQTPDTGVVSSTSFASYRSLVFHIHFSNILYESCTPAAFGWLF